MDWAKLASNALWVMRALASMILAAALGACETTRSTEPSQTATEQLVITTAIDNAVEMLNETLKSSLPSNTKVYVDTTYLDTTPADDLLFTKYEIGAVRDQLLRNGARLVTDKKDADDIVELFKDELETGTYLGSLSASTLIALNAALVQALGIP